MKQFILLLLSIMFFFTFETKAQNKPVIHNWIASAMMNGANDASTRHFVRLADGTLQSFAPGGPLETVRGIDHVKEVVSGIQHILALKEDGTVWAWGSNDEGQLGNASLAKKKTSTYTSFENSPTPVQVTGIKNAIAIAATSDQSYALLADGSVWAWGKVSHNGWSTIVQWKKPTKLPGITDGVAISAEMVLLSDGTVMTWGDNNSGQLGRKGISSSIKPLKVPGISDAIAPASTHSGRMALLADGTITTWGINSHGKLGCGVDDMFNNSITHSDTPVKVKGISNAAAVSTSELTSLALLKDGTVRGWGDGRLGSLGRRGIENTPSPIVINNLKNAIAIHAGTYGGFALLADGSLMGWGANMVATGQHRLSYTVIKIASLGSNAPQH